MRQPCSTAVFRLKSLTNPRQSPFNRVRAENYSPHRGKKMNKKRNKSLTNPRQPPLIGRGQRIILRSGVKNE